MSVAAKMKDCPLMVVKFLHLYRRYHVTKEEDDISMTEGPKKSQVGNDNTMKVTADQGFTKGNNTFIPDSPYISRSQVSVFRNGIDGDWL